MTRVVDGRVNHAKAQLRAEEALRLLAPGCIRIEIAGSIRRGVARVKDIEFVAEPKVGADLFGQATGADELLVTIRRQVRARKLLWRTRAGAGVAEPEKVDGRRYYLLATIDGIPIDLFVVRPPARWGAIVAIRTGPADYARRLVTVARDRGYRCADGRLVSLADGVERATPSERDFIEACGLPYTDPRDRR